VQNEIWDTSMTASPICGAPASLRRRGRQGVLRHSASMRESNNDRYDTSLIVRMGEKMRNQNSETFITFEH